VKNEATFCEAYANRYESSKGKNILMNNFPKRQAGQNILGK